MNDQRRKPSVIYSEGKVNKSEETRRWSSLIRFCDSEFWLEPLKLKYLTQLNVDTLRDLLLINGSSGEDWTWTLTLWDFL